MSDTKALIATVREQHLRCTDYTRLCPGKARAAEQEMLTALNALSRRVEAMEAVVEAARILPNGPIRRALSALDAIDTEESDG